MNLYDKCKRKTDKLLLILYTARQELIFFLRLLALRIAEASRLQLVHLPPQFQAQLNTNQNKWQLFQSTLLAQKITEGAKENFRQQGLKSLNLSKKITRFFAKKFQRYFPKFYEFLAQIVVQNLQNIRAIGVKAHLKSNSQIRNQMISLNRTSLDFEIYKLRNLSTNYSVLLNPRTKPIYLQKSQKNDKFYQPFSEIKMLKTIIRHYDNLLFKYSTPHLQKAGLYDILSLAEKDKQTQSLLRKDESFLEMDLRVRKIVLQLKQARVVSIQLSKKSDLQKVKSFRLMTNYAKLKSSERLSIKLGRQTSPTPKRVPRTESRVNQLQILKNLQFLLQNELVQLPQIKSVYPARGLEREEKKKLKLKSVRKRGVLFLSSMY